MNTAHTIRSFDGIAGATTQQTSTDTAQSLSSAILVSSSNKQPNGLIISIETAAIRYAFAATPTQAGAGHLGPIGSTIVLNSSQMIQKFKFISSGAGVHATLQITPLF